MGAVQAKVPARKLTGPLGLDSASGGIRRVRFLGGSCAPRGVLASAHTPDLTDFAPQPPLCSGPRYRTAFLADTEVTTSASCRGSIEQLSEPEQHISTIPKSKSQHPTLLKKARPGLPLEPLSL